MSALIRRIINTTSAPAAIGPYSQSVVVDRTMYISGQLGMDVASGQLVDGGVQAQAKQALVNMGEILKAANCNYTNVVKTTVLLADINDFNSVNEVYKTFFTSNFPARAAYQVAALPRVSMNHMFTSPQNYSVEGVDFPWQLAACSCIFLHLQYI
uniref:2-iminobutanoate/2-iminopropanoate deaminase n=1 Tax=Labrus bergylta TaxID=56723 RepID=A0A3Q3NM31_9LABR